MLLAASLKVKADDMGFYSINDSRHIDIVEPTSLCKDRDGFLWVASRTDVIRISDTQHTIYNLPDIHKGANNFRLKYIQNRLIAFNTKGDIYIYDTKLDKFKKIANAAKLLDNEDIYIFDVTVDSEGKIWIESSDGLFYSDGNKLHKMSEVEGLPTSIINDESGNVIAVTTQGIYWIDTNSMKPQHLNKTHGLVASSLYLDKTRDRLWIGTVSQGLFHYDFGTDKVAKVPISDFPQQLIKDIKAVSDSTIWCAIDGRGIWEINSNDGTLRNVYQENASKPYAIRGNGVQEIFYESPDKVWICSFTGGVELREMESSPITQLKHSADNPNSLVNNYIYEAFEDSRGNIWMGTNSGISRRNPLSGDWLNFFEEKGKETFIVRAVSEDANGDIWVGAYSHGIFVLDGENPQIKTRHRSEIGLLSSTGFIYDILKDSNGDMWVAGMTPEILRYKDDGQGFEKYSTPVVSRIVEFDDNTLILVSFDKLLAFDKNTKKHNVILSDNLLEDVAVVDSKVWAAIRGKGLVAYDMNTRKLSNYDISHGIISNNITSLVKDGKKLWLGTDKGICCFNTLDNIVTSYSLPAQYQTTIYNAHAGISLSDGTIGWGTSDGFLNFNPEELIPIQEDGHIFIQDIIISGQSIRKLPELMPATPLDSIKRLRLPLSLNNVTLDLLSLRTGAQKVLFSWKMDGEDEDWSTPSETGHINYSGLNPGTHTLTLRLYHQGAITERVIDIVVEPPFYLTWWFLSGIVITLAIITLGIMHFHKRRKQRQAQEAAIGASTTEPDATTFDDDSESFYDPEESNREFLTNATQVVIKHLSDIGFNKDTFAKEMGISTSLLFKRLKNVTGLSVVSFIRDVRMNKAMDMIKSGQHSITETAEICGFASIGYFSTVFKKHFGKLPTDVRPIKPHEPNLTEPIKTQDRNQTV